MPETGIILLLSNIQTLHVSAWFVMMLKQYIHVQFPVVFFDNRLPKVGQQEELRHSQSWQQVTPYRHLWFMLILGICWSHFMEGKVVWYEKNCWTVLAACECTDQTQHQDSLIGSNTDYT